jgi:hypothetical protein
MQSIPDGNLLSMVPLRNRPDVFPILAKAFSKLEGTLLAGLHEQAFLLLHSLAAL